MNESILFHHGIKGQKWGVRRFENEDGTLTDAGKERYYGNDSDLLNGRLATRTAIKRQIDEFQRSLGMKPKDNIDEMPDKIKKATILSSERNAYRQEMLDKCKGMPAETKRYTEMSDQEIEDEIRRKQDLKRKLIIAGVALGVTATVAAGLYIRNKGIDAGSDLIDSGLDINTPDGMSKFKDTVGKAMKSESDDFLTVMDEGSVIHRMVGFKDFDMSKAGNGPMYTSYLNRDKNTYAMFLADHFGTGKRWDVTLQTTKQIKVPTRKQAAEIIDNLVKTDPTFLRGHDSIDSGTKSAIKSLMSTKEGKEASDNFVYAAYSFVKQNGDASKLQDAFKRHGFDAIYDYFDIDSGFTNKPLIFLDPQGSLKKVGEQFVDSSYQRKAIRELRAEFSKLTDSVKRILSWYE